MSCSMYNGGYTPPDCDYRVLDDFIKLGYNVSYESFMNPHKRFVILTFNKEEFTRINIPIYNDGLTPYTLVKEFKKHEITLKRNEKINNILNEED